MAKKFTGLLALITLGASSLAAAAGAQTSAVAECSDGQPLSPSALQAAAKKVQENYADIDSLTARFVQNSYLASLEISETSSGTVAFQRPGKLRWEYQEPEPSLAVLNGSTMWWYQSIDNQVIVDEVSRALLSELPVAFLAGLGEIDRDFKILSGCREAGDIRLLLQPKSSAQQELDEQERALDAVGLSVDAASYLPRRIEIKDVSGNITSVTLGKSEVDAQLDPALFRFVAPEGADVMDRRREAEKKPAD